MEGQSSSNRASRCMASQGERGHEGTHRNQHAALNMPISYLPKTTSLILCNVFMVNSAILGFTARTQLTMTTMGIWGKLACSIWLGSGIEFQLLPLIGWVFCFEMLINVSLGSETSVLETAVLRSRSDSFHDYANKTPLKLSFGLQVVIMDENEWANYCETGFCIHLCVCVGELERHRTKSIERRRETGLCVLFICNKNL